MHRLIFNELFTPDMALLERAVASRCHEVLTLLRKEREEEDKG